MKETDCVLRFDLSLPIPPTTPSVAVHVVTCNIQHPGQVSN